MIVAEILRTKDTDVKNVSTSMSILELACYLHAQQIGAVIVSDDGCSIDGIISERDVVRGHAKYEHNLSEVRVSELMTKAVITCSPQDSIRDVAKVMTERRIRHLPVKDGDRLVGIITIGDVLKERLAEVKLEANVLRDYAIACR
jgi:CBS domain-containing protein